MLKNIKKIGIIGWIFFIFVLHVFAGENGTLLSDLINQLAKEINEGLVNEFTVKNLGRTLDPKAVEPLIQVLETESLTIRPSPGDAQYINAAKYLGEIGDKKAIPALKNFLQKRINSDTFPWATQIGRLNGRWFNWLRRKEIIEASLALWQMGELYPALAAMMDIARQFANDTSSLWDLNRLFGINPTLFKKDTVAVRTIYDYIYEGTRYKSDWLRTSATACLAKYPRSENDKKYAFDIGLQLLNGSKPYVIRESAVRIMMYIGDENAKEILRKLSKEDKDELIRFRAKEALNKILIGKNRGGI